MRVGVLWKVPDAGIDAIFAHVDGNRFEWSSAAIRGPLSMELEKNTADGRSSGREELSELSLNSYSQMRSHGQSASSFQF